MAPHLTSLGAERIRTRRWAAAAVEVADVASRLSGIRADLAREETEDPTRPHTRDAVMNVIVCGESPGPVMRAARAMRTLAVHHPSRTIVVIAEDRGVGAVDAEVESESHVLMGSAQIAYEQAVLKTPRAALDNLFTFAAPLLLSDVPTYLWWTGPGGMDGRIRRAAVACQALIVDSATFAEPRLTVVALARLRSEGRPRLGDLHWGRTLAWREALAQVFNPAARRPYLNGVESVEIRYDAAPGGFTAAALLAGWLSDRLGWRVEEVTGAASGPIQARLAARRRAVSLSAIPGGAAEEGLGTLERVRLTASRRGRRLELELHRRPEAGAILVELRGPDGALSHALPVEPYDDADLLCHLIPELAGDPVYVGALLAAARLLEAAP